MALANRSSKQKMLAAAALAVLIAGGIVAAVLATGQDHSAPQRRGTIGSGSAQTPRLARNGDLAIAATYLAVTPARLIGELRSGKALAQVAGATKGRSATGLIDRIVAAREATLAAAVASGQLTSAQEKTAITSLRGRVAARVSRVGGYQSAVGRRAVPAPAVTAAYLGLAQAQLRAELRSGRTLAQLANGLRGKSAGGLIAAIVADTKARLAVAVRAGTLTPANERPLLQRLQQRIATEVNGT
jgi:hypothetical protein